EVDYARNVGPGGCLRGVPRCEPRTALDERKRAEILAPLEQNIVEADMGWMRFQHGRRHGLAAEPLLEIVEWSDFAVAHHQQLAVEHHALRNGLDHVGKRAGDVVARPREQPPPPALIHAPASA